MYQLHRYPLHFQQGMLEVGTWRKVQKIKIETGVWFVEACNIATSENRAAPTLRGQPMAAVVHSSGGPRRQTTRSQTDLTWPRDLKEPLLVVSSMSHFIPRLIQLHLKLTHTLLLKIKECFLLLSHHPSQAIVQRVMHHQSLPEGLDYPRG